MIPYGRQSIDEQDIKEVENVLRSGWITQGPKIQEFEEALAKYCGASYAVALSSGTAALHAAFSAIGLSSGDEFITSPMTFVATSNAGLLLGAKPVFVDIDENTGNIDTARIEEKITSKTKAIVPIDYTGRPVDLDKIKEIAEKYNLAVVEDASQALGAEYKGRKIGSFSDLTTFSFHPVKNITTGEGGAVLTDNEEYYKKMKRFITHGITKENIDEKLGGWYFDMVELGMNYRLTDIACALGISQLKKMGYFLKKRLDIVRRYNEAFKGFKNIILPLEDDEKYKSAWHLYVIRLDKSLIGRKFEIFNKLRENGIGVQVHHIPVYAHSYYKRLGYTSNGFRNTEHWYESAISLPLYADLNLEDQEYVVRKVKEILI